MRGPYFEGWYFKLQTGQGEALALIPAFHIDRSGRRSASLQVIVRDQSWWLDYPGDALQVQTEPLRIRLGASSFAEEGWRCPWNGPGCPCTVPSGSARFED